MTSLIELVHERGPLTVAAFMDLALYHPDLGYYARAGQRSGRSGDFFTSVDVGPLFGALVAHQLAEMQALLGDEPFDLVEAGAGNGRLSADILRAARQRHPALFERIHLHLVEASPAARTIQARTLDGFEHLIASSNDTLPPQISGAIIANELLDALPTHQVVMRPDGLRETYVEAVPHAGAWRLRTREDLPSTPALKKYLDALNVVLEPGWRVEINLNAVDWVRQAARCMTRGFLVLLDYGHEAHELYSETHAQGTLTTYQRHVAQVPGADPGEPPWLSHPGDCDLTAHVDLTSVRRAALDEGLDLIACLDQTYFLLGVIASLSGSDVEALSEPRTAAQLKTLVMPGGLGSTHKVLVLGKHVGAPALKSASFRVRVT